MPGTHGGRPERDGKTDRDPHVLKGISVDREVLVCVAWEARGAEGTAEARKDCQGGAQAQERTPQPPSRAVGPRLPPKYPKAPGNPKGEGDGSKP